MTKLLSKLLSKPRTAEAPKPPKAPPPAPKPGFSGSSSFQPAGVRRGPALGVSAPVAAPGTASAEQGPNMAKAHGGHAGLASAVQNLLRNAQAPAMATQGFTAQTAGEVHTLGPEQGATEPGTADVEAAAQRVDAVYQREGAGPAAAALEEEARALGDPEAVDALLEAAAPTVEAISEELAERVDINVDDSGDGAHRVTEQGVRSLSAVADLATGEGVDLLAGAMATALAAHGDRSNLNQLDDRFRDLAGEGGGVRLASALALELINTHGMLEAGNEILNEATRGVEALTGNFQEVQGEYAELQQRLNADLVAFGPGMTDAQKEAYQEAFWADPERLAVKEKLDAAADALAAAMTEASPALETLAAQGDSEAAKKLLDAYESLALSDTHAQLALEFAGRLSGNEALAAKIDEHTDGTLEDRLGDGIIAEATPRVQADLMAAYADEGPEGVERAIAAFQGLIEPIKAGVTFKKLADRMKELDETLDTFRNFKNASENDLARAQRLMEKWDDSGKFGRAMGVAALAFGIYSGVQNFGEGDWPEGLTDILGAYRGGVHTAAGLVGTFTRSAELAGDVAKFGGKFLPFVGLALDGVQLKNDIEALSQDGADAGEIISVVGTGISLVGDVLELVPAVGTVIGGAVGILGSAVHALGGLISNFINGDRERKELLEDRQALLEAAGVSDSNAELLLGDIHHNAQFATLGLSREQFLEYKRMVADGFAANDVNAIDALWTAGRAAALLGLEGDEAMAFIHEVSKDPDTMYRLKLRLGPDYFFDADLGDADQAVIDGQTAIRDYLAEELETLGIDPASIDPADANLAYFVAHSS